MAYDSSTIDRPAESQHRHERLFLTGVAAFAAVVLLGMVAFAIYVATG
jgi:hypothetical protein